MTTPLDSIRSGRRSILAAGALAAAAPIRKTSATKKRPVRFAFFGTASEQRAYQRVIDAFEAAYPDVAVEAVGLDSGDATLAAGARGVGSGLPWLQTGGPYQPWLWRELASPTAPDVFVLAYQRFPAVAARGVLEPLGPHLAASAVLDPADFYPATLDAFRSPDIPDDGLGALPLNASSLAVYYNPDHFADAGVRAPADDWSWGDFADAASALTRGRDRTGRADVYGLAIEPRLTRSAAFVWGAGGNLVDDDERPTRLTLDTPEALEGLQWFAELGPSGRRVTPTAAEARQFNDLARFAAGRAAMFVHTRRVVPILRETEGLSWDVAPLPIGKGPANVLHSDGVCMLAGARDKDAAWAFVEFVIGPVGQAILAQTGRTVPSLRSVAESDDFLKGTSIPFSLGGERVSLAPTRAGVFVDNVKIARRVPMVATLPAVEGAFDHAFKYAFYVDADARTAAASIARELSGILGSRLTVPRFMFNEPTTEAEE